MRRLLIAIFTTLLVCGCADRDAGLIKESLKQDKSTFEQALGEFDLDPEQSILKLIEFYETNHKARSDRVDALKKTVSNREHPLLKDAIELLRSENRIVAITKGSFSRSISIMAQMEKFLGAPTPLLAKEILDEIERAESELNEIDELEKTISSASKSLEIEPVSSGDIDKSRQVVKRNFDSIKQARPVYKDYLDTAAGLKR